MGSQDTLSLVLPRLRQVKEYSKYYSSLCPLHDDKKPSFLLYKDGWYRCLGCGRTGDLYSLNRILSGRAGKSLSVRSELSDFHIPQIPASSEIFAMSAHETLVTNSESLGWYLRMRGLENQILAQKLGWYNGWYTIPSYNYDGDYVGMVLRAGRHIQEASGLRYVIKTKGSLYFPDWYLARTCDYIVVTFGILDAITLTQLRIPACSSIHGMTFSIEELDWARKRILFFPDKGEEAQGRKLYSKLGWRGRMIEFDYGDECKDINDLHMAGRDMDISNAVCGAL